MEPQFPDNLFGGQKIIRPGELPEDATYDLYAGVPAHIIALKDSVAKNRKGNTLYDDMFDPNNIDLNAEEYNQKKNLESVDKTTQAALASTAHLDDQAFLDRLNKVREMTGQAPMLPEDPVLQDPNWMQNAAALLGSIFAPEFALDLAAMPFQYQLQEQQKAKDKAYQQYQIEAEKHNQLLKLGAYEMEELGKRDLARYEADFQRETLDKTQAFQASEAQKGRDFNQGLFNQETQRMFSMLEKEQKHNIVMQYVQQALNPAIGAEARLAASETLKGLGIDIKAFEGKTPQEQLMEVQTQLAGTELKFAEGTLEHRINQEKAKWETMTKQNMLLDKEIKWYDKKAQADIDNARASVANVYSLINDRTFQQGFQLSEQQRAYLSGVQDNILGSIKAFGTQIEANNSRINNINTQLSKPGIKQDERQALETERDSLTKQNEALASQAGGLQEQLDSFNEYFVERSGISMGETGLGESYLGLPYSWGGGSLDGPSYGIGRGSQTKGFDCSGFTRAVAYQDFGVTLPRTAIEQWNFAEKNGKTVDLSDPDNLQTGDFCYFKTSKGYHTGIVVFKNGVPYLRNAPSTGQVIADKPLAIYLKSMKLLGAARFGKEFRSPEKEKLDPQGGMPMGGG